MRKLLTFAIAAAALALGASTLIYYQKLQRTQANLAEVKAAEQTSRERYANTIDAIAEIQDSLNAIAVNEPSMNANSPGLSAEQQMSGPNGRVALDRIAVLRQSIMRNKERIRQLEASLKASGLKTAGLQKMLANLKSTVADKQNEVTQLSQRVEQLQTQVAGLETTVAETQQTVVQRDQIIEQKRNELATVYVVMGTKRELTTQGVVVAKGGVLGMGKTLTPSAQIAESVLKPIDTDRETVLRIEAAKAQVVSAQPIASYEIKPVEGGLELHILDPVEFRKVKQLVIVTA